MASKSFTWTYSGGGSCTFTTHSTTATVVASSSTFEIPIPSATFKTSNIWGTTTRKGKLYTRVGDTANYYSAFSNTVSTDTGQMSIPAGTTQHSTAWYFASHNPTEGHVTITCKLGTDSNVLQGAIYAYSSSGSVIGHDAPPSLITFYTVTVVLDAPPDVTLGTPTYEDPHYAGFGTYTVPITSASAKYGGKIVETLLTVGSQTAHQTYSSASISNETISVTPTVAGTYTPKLVVFDSRGQATQISLPQITVNPYTAPATNFNVFRVNDNALRDDEGHLCLIDASISYTSAIATLEEPTVKIDGTNISQLAGASITWYTNWDNTSGVSGAISDWSALTPTNDSVKVYGLIDWSYSTTGKFAEDKSYQITVQAEDSNGKVSTAISQTLSTAYYTIDFKAGGKEIAFGAPANDTLTTHQEEVGLFKCGMEAQFNEHAEFDEAVEFNEETTFDKGIQRVGENIDSTLSSVSEAMYDTGVVVEDTNGVRIGMLETTQLQDGRLGTGVNTRRTVNGSTIQHGFNMYIANDGTRTVGVSESAPWRTAFGLGGVGTVYSGSKSINVTANADAYVEGGTVTLPAGRYVVCVRASFPSSSTNGQVRVQIYNKTAETVTISGGGYGSGWLSEALTWIISLSSQCVIAVRASASVARSSVGTNIAAIRII